jgi:hypothetical protein
MLFVKKQGVNQVVKILTPGHLSRPVARLRPGAVIKG